MVPPCYIHVHVTLPQQILSTLCPVCLPSSCVMMKVLKLAEYIVHNP